MSATKTAAHKLTLYDLAEEAVALDDLTAMDDGEWTATAQALHDGLMGKLLLKTDKCAGYIRELESREAAVKDEADRLAARAKTLKSRVEWMKKYACDAMGVMQRDKLVGTYFTIARQKNSAPALSVTVLPGALPKAYQKTIPAQVVADNAAIVTALKAGEVIEGCEIVYGHHVRIR